MAAVVPLKPRGTFDHRDPPKVCTPKKRASKMWLVRNPKVRNLHLFLGSGRFREERFVLPDWEQQLTGGGDADSTHTYHPIPTDQAPHLSTCIRTCIHSSTFIYNVHTCIYIHVLVLSAYAEICIHVHTWLGITSSSALLKPIHFAATNPSLPLPS